MVAGHNLNLTQCLNRASESCHFVRLSTSVTSESKGLMVVSRGMPIAPKKLDAEVRVARFRDEETPMGSKANRPAGITAVSTLLVTLGAVVSGLSILSLCQDISILTTPTGLRLEAIMLGFMFAGFTFAGFGVGLYEGYSWSRPASLGALAFVATLLVFSLASSGLVNNAVSYQSGLLGLLATSVFYLSLPTAKRFFRPLQQSLNASGSMQAETAGAFQRAS
jgi:hypothetical protein